MSDTRKLNDVNLEAVGGLVQAIQGDPCKADTTWRASVKWNGAFRSSVKIREFEAYGCDEPPALGGTDTAPNPVEILLGALGSCLATGYAANAAVAGIEIKDLRIDLEGNINLETFLGLNPAGNAGYDGLRAKVYLESDADDEAIQKLHQQVVGTSPVGHTIQRAVPVKVELS